MLLFNAVVKGNPPCTGLQFSPSLVRTLTLAFSNNGVCTSVSDATGLCKICSCTFANVQSCGVDFDKIRFECSRCRSLVLDHCQEFGVDCTANGILAIFRLVNHRPVTFAFSDNPILLSDPSRNLLSVVIGCSVRIDFDNITFINLGSGCRCRRFCFSGCTKSFVYFSSNFTVSAIKIFTGARFVCI